MINIVIIIGVLALSSYSWISIIWLRASLLQNLLAPWHRITIQLVKFLLVMYLFDFATRYGYVGKGKHLDSLSWASLAESHLRQSNLKCYEFESIRNNANAVKLGFSLQMVVAKL